MWILDEKPNKLKEHYVQQYNECTNYSLSDVYMRCSSTKQSIWNGYVNKYKDVVVSSFKCLGSNRYIFTMAAVIKEDDGYYLLRVSAFRDMKVKVRRG